jgi:hypothetical protein
MKLRIILTMAAAVYMFMCPATPGQVSAVTPGTKFYMFQLGRGGCQPSERRVPAGLVGLHLLNFSHIPNLNMVLHPDSGANINSKTLTSTDYRWTQAVTLAAGTYILEATGEPLLHCTVIAQ